MPRCARRIATLDTWDKFKLIFWKFKAVMDIIQNKKAPYKIALQTISDEWCLHPLSGELCSAFAAESSIR